MPAKWREVDKGKLSNSSGPVSPLKRSEILPAYGAQHHRDALWEGGNKALPPMWTEWKNKGFDSSYSEGTFNVSAMHRPLPGVRLDYPGWLLPGCEWHIAPHGRSYFVNHNTRTTSWKKPTPERTAGSLMPECIIKTDNQYNSLCLACLGSGNIMSTSNDGSIHQWTRDGKPVGKLADHGGRMSVTAMAVSVDETMIVCGNSDGKVWLWNIKEGSVVGNPREGNNDAYVACLDWSPNGVEVAGGWRDGTIRRWNPATGRQIASPIMTGDEAVWTVKYSPQGDKFASSGDDAIRVWSKDGELLIEIKAHNLGRSLCWSKDGAHIFSASYDNTIRKWQSIDGKELVGFQGHTNAVSSIFLSPDGCHLVSASFDYTVRIWDLKTNQQLGDPLWHDDHVWAVAMSSDGRYFASAINEPNSTIYYVWSLEAAFERARGVDGNAEPNAKIKGLVARPRDISLAPRHQINNRGLTRYGNDFFSEDTNPTSRRSAETSSSPGLRELFGFLRSSPRPANAPQQLIQLQPRRSNFASFPVRISRRPIDVAPCRDEDRYDMALSPSLTQKPPQLCNVRAATMLIAQRRKDRLLRDDYHKLLRGKVLLLNQKNHI